MVEHDPRMVPGSRQASGLSATDWAVLARLPLFAGLERNRLASLLASAAVVERPRHAVLFVQDEPATRFYILFGGWVKLFRSTAAGQESVIALIGPHESFAEAAIFGSREYPVSAEVIDDARLLSVPADSFLARMREDPELALKMLAAMARHLRELVAHLEQLSGTSALQRVATFLLRLCPPGTESAEIRLPLDKALIANRLGMQPETLSRGLARMREVGIISRRGRMEIPDIAALRRLAGGGKP